MVDQLPALFYTKQCHLMFLKLCSLYKKFNSTVKQSSLGAVGMHCVLGSHPRKEKRDDSSSPNHSVTCKLCVQLKTTALVLLRCIYVSAVQMIVYSVIGFCTIILCLYAEGKHP